MIFDIDELLKWSKMMNATDPNFKKSYQHYNELWNAIMKQAKKMVVEDPIALYIFGLSLHSFTELALMKSFTAQGMRKEDAIEITEHLRTVAQLFGQQVAMQVEEK